MRIRTLMLAALACGCADRSGPVNVVVLGEVAPGRFALAPHPLATLTSVAEGRGGVATLLKGAKVDPETNELIDGGGPVAIQFFEGTGGEIVPADLESLSLLSFYGHVEDSVRYFQSLGVDVGAFTPLPTYVRPDIGGQTLSFSDNAAFVSELHGFVLPAAFFFQSDVPLPANDGVITHEFTHAVFFYLLNGHAKEPREVTEQWPVPAFNYLFGLNEGLADCHGALRTGDPNFIAPSLPIASADRDMTVKRPFTADWRSFVEGAVVQDPHVLGAVVAAAVWQATEGIDHLRTAATLIASVEALKNTYGPDFRISVWINLWIQQTSPSERAQICPVMLDRFMIIQNEITACETH
jgi:hypothetical protein